MVNQRLHKNDIKEFGHNLQTVHHVKDADKAKTPKLTEAKRCSSKLKISQHVRYTSENC
jgi:hypothetical protein